MKILRKKCTRTRKVASILKERVIPSINLNLVYESRFLNDIRLRPQISSASLSLRLDCDFVVGSVIFPGSTLPIIQSQTLADHILEDIN